MTIAAGFRCWDGVLLVADSRHSIGDAAYQNPKLWVIDCPESGSLFVLTAAGADNAILETVDSLKHDPIIYANSVSFEMIEAVISG